MRALTPKQYIDLTCKKIRITAIYNTATFIYPQEIKRIFQVRA